MSATTETLPLTDDGWTAENLDYFPDFAGIAEAAEARRLAEIKFYGEECPR